MIIRAAQTKETETPQARRGLGTTFTRLLAGKHKGSCLRALAVNRLPAGSGWGPKNHADLEEFFYILSGQATVRDADKTEDLHPGDFVIVRAKEWGAIQNTGPEDLVFLSGLVTATRNVIDLKEIFG